ncbi:MAG: hypothetical protein JWR21_2862, partial [Herminiimonas sp.]|nr:hypothetical protein [Herminiimonas sp.]
IDRAAVSQRTRVEVAGKDVIRARVKCHFRSMSNKCSQNNNDELGSPGTGAFAEILCPAQVVFLTLLLHGVGTSD